MTLERLIWVAVSLGLAVLAVRYIREAGDMEHSFIASDRIMRPYAEDALRRFKSEQKVDDAKINRMFFVSFGYLSSYICIRLVPRPHVYGGTRSYCYENNMPVRLAFVDQSR